MVFEISKYLNKKPKIDKTVFVAEGSNVIGSVEIKKNSSVCKYIPCCVEHLSL